MSKSSRRTFLVMSGAGAAAAGVAAAGLAGPAGAATPKPVSTPDDAAPLVVHISDPASGELTLLVGERELVVHDADLVGRITRAAKEV